MRRVSALSVTVALIVAGCSSSGEKATTAASIPASASAPTSAAPALPDSLASAKGWLAYSTFVRDHEDRVHLARVNGSQEHEAFPQLKGEVLRAAFSPDGTRLAVEHRPPNDGPHNVYIGDPDGKNARVIAECKLGVCGHEYPAWSPDGTYLATAVTFGRPDGDDPAPESGISIIDVKTGVERVILRSPTKEFQQELVHWAANGRQLVLYRWRSAPGALLPYEHSPDAQAAVFIVNVDGKGLKRLTDWKAPCGDPDWSPDGSQIICAAYPPYDFTTAQNGGIYTMKPNGSDLLALMKNDSQGLRPGHPRFTPDGKAVLYIGAATPNWDVAPRHLYVLDLATGRSTPVLTKRDFYTRPSLQPMP